MTITVGGEKKKDQKKEKATRSTQLILKVASAVLEVRSVSLYIYCARLMSEQLRREEKKFEMALINLHSLHIGLT